MGTRSRIGVYKGENQVESVYCHWDGYPSYNGKIILEHWNDIDKLTELLKGGDMSALEAELNDIKFYGASEDPKLCAAQEHSIYAWPDDNHEYRYLYVPELGWKLYSNHQHEFGWVDLTPKIVKESCISEEDLKPFKF